MTWTFVSCESWWNAQRIELAHFVPPVGPKLAGPVDRAMIIRDAVEALDPNDATLFTQSGKPTVQAVELVLGFDITADERDEAYEAYRGKSGGRVDGHGRRYPGISPRY